MSFGVGILVYVLHMPIGLLSSLPQRNFPDLPHPQLQHSACMVVSIVGHRMTGTDLQLQGSRHARVWVLPVKSY